MHYQIAPSLLSADWARLGEDSAAVIKAGADLLHLDVMDNHFVPNLTCGPMVCEALRQYGIEAEIDVHLMTRPVDRLIKEFAKAGASRISFHPEASDQMDHSLDLIRNHGCKAGLAINPATTLDCLKFVMDKLDFLLMMSVNPGFGGQAFIPGSLDKIKQARQLVKDSGMDIQIAVDGGVKLDNIYQVAEAGADTFILGSGIFHHADYAKIIGDLRSELKKVKSHG